MRFLKNICKTCWKLFFAANKTAGKFLTAGHGFMFFATKKGEPQSSPPTRGSNFFLFERRTNRIGARRRIARSYTDFFGAACAFAVVINTVGNVAPDAVVLFYGLT